MSPLLPSVNECLQRRINFHRTMQLLLISFLMVLCIYTCPLNHHDEPKAYVLNREQALSLSSSSSSSSKGENAGIYVGLGGSFTGGGNTMDSSVVFSSVGCSFNFVFRLSLIKLNRNTKLNEQPTEENTTEESMVFPPPVNEPPSPTYIPAFSPLEEEEEEELKLKACSRFSTYAFGSS